MSKSCRCKWDRNFSLVLTVVAFVLSATIREAQSQETTDNKTQGDLPQTGSGAIEESPKDTAQKENEDPVESVPGENGEKKECLPECRTGYVCVEGECKSLCNPPCKVTEICTGNGICIPSAEEKSECLPKCREGYTCIGGECKSPCNPPCRVTEMCTGNGHCVPKALNQAVDFGVTLIRKQQPFSSEEHRKYNLMKYDESRRQRTNGVVLAVTGALTVATGIVLVTARRMKYGDTDQGKMAKVFGWTAQGIGVFMFGGGLYLRGKSKREMEQAEAGFYNPSLDSPPIVEPDSKVVSSKKSAKARGLTFGFKF